MVTKHMSKNELFCSGNISVNATTHRNRQCKQWIPQKIEIQVQSCPFQVTGSYKVEDWGSTKQEWTYWQHCQFFKPTRGGIVDLLLGVDNVHLHNSIADVRGKNVGPIARIWPLGWTCVGITSEKASEGESSHFVHFLKEVQGDRQLWDSVSSCTLDDKWVWNCTVLGTVVVVSW